VKTDIAGLTAVWIIRNNMDAFATLSPSGPAGASRSASGLLAARGEEKEDGRSEESKSYQKGAHEVPSRSVKGGSRA
jgi:hypothetical protein